MGNGKREKTKKPWKNAQNLFWFCEKLRCNSQQSFQMCCLASLNALLKKSVLTFRTQVDRIRILLGFGQDSNPVWIRILPAKDSNPAWIRILAFRTVRWANPSLFPSRESVVFRILHPFSLAHYSHCELLARPVGRTDISVKIRISLFVAQLYKID